MRAVIAHRVVMARLGTRNQNAGWQDEHIQLAAVFRGGHAAGIHDCGLSIGNGEGENRVLTEAWVVLFNIGTSLLSASAVGRGASSSEFAPAFFSGRALELAAA
jgi:hypothetical protein